MFKRTILLFLWLFVAGIVSAQESWRYVDPLIGSEGDGRVFIGPTMPFGMVKPGPDAVSMQNAGWAPMPEAVKGFSQIHVSGTGGGQKYGNILIQPLKKGQAFSMKGLLVPDGKIEQIPVYASVRETENVQLGYYSSVYKNGIQTEITTSERCALYRFKNAEQLFIDVASFLGMDTIPNKRETQQYVSSYLKQKSATEVEGYTSVRGGWNNGDAYKVYFCLQSDHPLKTIQQNQLFALFDIEHSNLSSLEEEPEVGLKIGISYISCAQAKSNIVANSFDTQLHALQKSWQNMLSKLPYQGNSKELRMFYTALYHTLIMPVDKTGENPKWQGGPYYDDFYAIWDTYRTSFPLLMEYYPEHAVALVNSLLEIYKHDGYLPDARSGDCNGRTQGGSHAEAVIAEAFARGLKGIDYELALEAMIKDAEVPPADDEKEGRGGLKEYNALGYIPYGIPRAGTRTVEYSYDDYCIALVAKGLGKMDLYEKYLKRSSNWKNLWRSDYKWKGMQGFIMPKDANGNWLDSVVWGKSKVFHPTIPYRPDTKVAPWHIAWWDTFFYEALSAEYSLSIPHDIPGLIEACGGKKAFRKRLDTFFDEGHYNVGNEPSFMTPYLYSFIGRTDLASQRVSEIVNSNFNDTALGLPGNDDSGAMSSWLIWAMMGRYPVAGQGCYIDIDPVRIDENVFRTKDPVQVTLNPAAPKDAPSFKVSYVLNRQYRTWEYKYKQMKDGMRIWHHDCIYDIPADVVKHATGFCWESPYKPYKKYGCKGTFLFISQDALRNLNRNHAFVYDKITWREVERKGNEIHVKADIDGTEMWILNDKKLPLVLNMINNPLAIDWTITNEKN